MESPQTGNFGGKGVCVLGDRSRGRRIILPADSALCMFENKEGKLNQQPTNSNICKGKSVKTECDGADFCLVSFSF